MVAKILGMLMLIFGGAVSLELVGSVLWNTLELIGLLAKLLFSAGIAYIGFRLIKGTWSAPSEDM